MLKLSTRLAIAMVSLVLVTTVALGLITYQNISRLGLPRALDRLETRALLNATLLQSAIRAACDDMMALRSTAAVADLGAAYTGRLTDPAANDAATLWRNRFAVRFTAELWAKPRYARMRIAALDDGGRELIRVDHSGPGGAIRTAPAEELRQLGERPNFKAAAALSPRDIFVSEVELQPFPSRPGRAPFPVMRVAAPLFTAQGERFAVGVIDVDLEAEFDRIRAHMVDGRHIYIVNQRGEYLLHPDVRLGMQSGAEAAARIQSDFPGFDEAMVHGGSNGLWTNRDGAQFGVGWAAVTLAGGPTMMVIETTPYRNLDIGVAAIGASTLLGGIVAILFAITLALVLARSLSKPLEQITRAVEGFPRGQHVKLSRGGGLEIDVLSAAFNRMVSDVRQQSVLLNNVISTIADPVLVADERGNFVIANPAAQRMFGAKAGDSGVFSEKHFRVLLPDRITPYPREQWPVAVALRGEPVDGERLVVLSDPLGIDADVVVSARPLFDEAGVLCGAVAVCHDISWDLKAQEARIASEQMAQAIIDTALDAFIQVDSGGTVLRWSPKAENMLGWNRAEVMGKNLGELVLCGDRQTPSAERIAAAVRELDEGIAGRRYETVTLHRDGTEIATEVSMTAQRRRDVVIVNMFLRDITQSRAAEERMQHAQKMESVGELTGGLAHDFNNMLTVITGTIDVLADAVAHDPQLAAIAALISGAADRGAELTANLLAFARKQPLQPRATDVNALMIEVCKLLHPTLGRQIEVKTDLGADVWPALVDPGQLSSALVNLAINARDAMPDGGKLLLTTSNHEVAAHDSKFSGILDAGRYILIIVSDSGCGMPQPVLDKIFEPFFSTKESGRGTGLGLSMVYGFVKQSGGHIEALSAPGHGTTFLIYLPKASAQPAALAPDHEASIARGNETILCVEDDDNVRSYVLTRLESLGYKTIAAANAAEALAIVDRGDPFDLLFTDIVMPGKINGRQLAEAVAQRRPCLKVLFTSGYTENDDIINHAQMNGDILLLAKPYRRADLNRMIRLALESPPPAIIQPVRAEVAE